MENLVQLVVLDRSGSESVYNQWTVPDTEASTLAATHRDRGNQVVSQVSAPPDAVIMREVPYCMYGKCLCTCRNTVTCCAQNDHY